MIAALVMWIAICLLVAAIGAAASVRADSFYAELVRPDWAPPATVFGPVWTTLYALMAVAAWLVWNTREARFARVALSLFVLQLILNALWSWLFFGWHHGGLAFLDIVLLWLSIVATLVLFWRIKPLAGLLLLPYLLWVTFASALNYQIWQLNPSLLDYWNNGRGASVPDEPIEPTRLIAASAFAARHVVPDFLLNASAKAIESPRSGR